MEGKTKEADTGRGQLAPIESELRSNLLVWRQNLQTIGQGIQEKRPSDKNSGAKPDPALESWHTIIYRIIPEMDRAMNDLRVVAEDLAAAKADAEYRAVLVGAWPVNHFLDRLSYLGTALFGGGGAAFAYGAGFQDPLYRFGPAVSLWVLGLMLLTYSLRGLSRLDSSKWLYFADAFRIPEQFRPKSGIVFGRRGPLSSGGKPARKERHR